MWFDIVCIVLLVLAFVAGFQRGVIDTLLLIAGLVTAAVSTLFITPYVTAFLHSSFIEVSVALIYLILFLIFLMLCWSITTFIRMVWKFGKEDHPHTLWLGKTMGGLSLLSCMVLSIAVLSMFLDETSLMGEEQKDRSIGYRYLGPIRNQSHQLWQKISEYAHIATEQSTKKES